MIGSVLFCSTGLVHPSLPARVRAFAAIRSAVAQVSGGGRRSGLVRHHRGLRGLRLALRSGAGLVVVYIHRRGDAQTVVDQAERYLARGGRILALHAATASFRGNERWSRLLGARFAGHGAVGDHVVIRESAAGLGRVDLPERVELRDEAYAHAFHGPVEVWYRWEDGEPAAWSVGGESPAVTYFAPGHRARVWGQPAVRTILAAMIEVLAKSGGAT